jgi:hypothetical protein
MAELLGIIYWHERGTFPKENIKEIEAEFEEIKLKFSRHEYPKETNCRGNFIERGFRENCERYVFDFEELLPKDGWEQFDTKQDAWYFGVWVNKKTMQTFTYAEGDTTKVTCPTLESFKAELEDMVKFYGPPPPAFITCDDIGLSDGKLSPQGNVTAYYDKRPTIEEAKV